MSLIERIEVLLKTYNKDNFDYFEVIRRNRIEVRFEKGDESFKEELPRDNKSLLIVTDPGFSGKYLEELGIYTSAKVWKLKEESTEEVQQVISANQSPSEVMGFGGGRALDIAKMSAFKLGVPLVSVPTAPSHDGLIAKNCALKVAGEKKSFSTIYPRRIIVPKHLWKTSGDLKRAGALDIASNVTALQDVSLSMKKAGFVPDFEHMTYALLAMRKILKEQTMDSLAEALIMSGIAMDRQSNYCSGSEHEVEKSISAAGLGGHGRGTYLHGQLAGTGTLIAAKIYESYAGHLPKGLFFDQKTLYTEVRRIFEKYDVLTYALKPILEKKYALEKILKQVSEVRPERYTLWNAIDSRSIDWKKVLDDIMDE